MAPFVTARWPGDLPMHMKRTLEVLGRVSHGQLRVAS